MKRNFYQFVSARCSMRQRAVIAHRFSVMKFISFARRLFHHKNAYETGGAVLPAQLFCCGRNISSNRFFDVCKLFTGVPNMRVVAMFFLLLNGFAHGNGGFSLSTLSASARLQRHQDVCLPNLPAAVVNHKRCKYHTFRV